jgi:16S rRNA (cytosine1402-N4)-methyltransferase
MGVHAYNMLAQDVRNARCQPGADACFGECERSIMMKDADRHLPVMKDEAVAALALKQDGIYLDGTFGAGGYARAILSDAAHVRLIGIDRDPDALSAGQVLVAESRGRFALADGCFSDLDTIATDQGFGALDGIVLDIGVSSMQLDEALRGFSFRFDGPLDMRMAQSGQSAADIVNEADEARLADIIFHYGEERRARAVAKALVAARLEEPITTTRRLADIVSKVVHVPPGTIHPATRTFQGLRIAVNDELGELARALHAAERALTPGGRLAIVTFHSLEDRIVKTFLARRSGRSDGGSRFAPMQVRDEPTFTLIGKQPQAPSSAETAANPRARSAKLRVAERTTAPARGDDASVMDLAALPQTAAWKRG